MALIQKRGLLCLTPGMIIFVITQEFLKKLPYEAILKYIPPEVIKKYLSTLSQ